MLKRIPYIFAITLVVVMSVNPKPQAKEEQNSDIIFKKVTDSIISQFWVWHPTWAVSIGNHKYDDMLEVPSATNMKSRVAHYKNWMKAVDLFTNKELSQTSRMDYYILKNQLQSLIWSIDTFKSYTWNPAEYNVGQGFDLVLSNPNKPLRAKLAAVRKRLSSIPAYYQAARANMVKPTKEHLDLAIQQVNGSMYIFDKVIPDSLAKLNDKKFADSLNAQLSVATSSIKRYVTFLEDYKKNPKSEYRDFRIGKDLYNQKFNYDIQSHYTAVQIYERALIRKKEIQDEMQKRTAKLWPKYFGKQTLPTGLAAVKKMVDTLSTQHCDRDKFMQCIKDMLPKQEAFLKEKDLLTTDATKPLIVRQTPPYMEGSGAGASINDPGPYDANGKTFYNVSLLTDYTPAQAESYLREYNDYILQILNIHEAIPGHYTQLVYSNRSPSMIKSIFGNGAMVEGWAVYTERMMLEEGYGPATDEMWLMYYKWHLRSVMNTILDYSIQCLNMNETDAKKLMVNEGFQQQAEADGKWKRATLSQVQLTSYFTGFTEIYDLREELKKKQGADFNLKQFHEKFLSYGSAPVKYIREAMVQ